MGVSAAVCVGARIENPESIENFLHSLEQGLLHLARSQATASDIAIPLLLCSTATGGGSIERSLRAPECGAEKGMVVMREASRQVDFICLVGVCAEHRVLVQSQVLRATHMYVCAPVQEGRRYGPGRPRDTFLPPTRLMHDSGNHSPKICRALCVRCGPPRPNPPSCHSDFSSGKRQRGTLRHRRCAARTAHPCGRCCKRHCAAAVLDNEAGKRSMVAVSRFRVSRPTRPPHLLRAVACSHSRHSLRAVGRCGAHLPASRSCSSCMQMRPPLRSRAAPTCAVRGSLPCSQPKQAGGASHRALRTCRIAGTGPEGRVVSHAVVRYCVVCCTILMGCIGEKTKKKKDTKGK